MGFHKKNLHRNSDTPNCGETFVILHGLPFFDQIQSKL